MFWLQFKKRSKLVLIDFKIWCIDSKYYFLSVILQLKAIHNIPTKFLTLKYRQTLISKKIRYIFLLKLVINTYRKKYLLLWFIFLIFNTITKIKSWTINLAKYLAPFIICFEALEYFQVNIYNLSFLLLKIKHNQTRFRIQSFLIIAKFYVK